MYKKMKEEVIATGSRFESDGHYGTVLYTGMVPPTKGDWLGVEWDDASRGKHDGTHEGNRYFTTSHPTSGSFIRPKKANLGFGFMTALQERYGKIEDENAGVIQEEMWVKGKNKQMTSVEVVGAQSVNLQQSQLNKLQEVCLRECHVSDPGPPGIIGQTIPSVTELNVSKTLLSSWKRVASITQQLNKLKSLNLSDNRLCIPDQPEELTSAFQSVQAAYINRMNYDWQQILECSKMFTCLLQLHLCFNNISSIQTVTPNLQHVKLLNLESNPIEEWSNVLTLGKLPNLEVLILNDTKLKKVEFPDVAHGQKTEYFRKLQALSLQRNNIADWSSINELNKLASLVNLKFKMNPLGEGESVTYLVSLILPRIAGLKVFNRSEMLGLDRKGAELDYLKLFGLDWKAAGGHQDPQKNKPSEEFCQTHPRYQQLADLYGPPEDSEMKKITSALKNNLIVITIESPLMPEKAPLTKKLPTTMSVQKLKTLLQRLYKVDPISMKLTYTSEQMPDQEIEFENDQKEIGYYSIDEGDTILVKW